MEPKPEPEQKRSRSQSSASHPDSTSTSTSSDPSSSSITAAATHDPEKQQHPTHLEPLSPRPSTHHRQHHDPESLRRTESHHSRAGADGYTWHDGDGGNSSGAGAEAAPAVGEEPYLVAFDGDADPECPRSMSTLRRWAIVLICASSSLCV